MTLRQALAKKADLIAQAKTIRDSAESAAELTDDQLAQIDDLMNQATETQQIIDRLERADALSSQIDSASADLATARRRTPSDATASVNITVGTPRVMDDAQRGFSSIGDFAMSVAGVHRGMVDERLQTLAAETSTTNRQSFGADGGFLVPPAFSASIWDGLADDPASLLPSTDQYTIPQGNDSLTIPANAETSRVDGSRFGGIRGYWRSELGQMSASRPTFREMKLEPSELYVFVPVTDKLLRNSGAIESYIQRAAMSEIMFKTNDAIIRGTGAGQPLGVLSAPSTISVAKETGQAADTVVFENITKMWARLHPRARANSVWYINQEVESQLLKLYISSGTAGVPVYLPAGGLSGSPFATLFGRPVVSSEFCSALGDVGDIILQDLKFYASATKSGIQSAVSMHLYFDYAQSVFRFQFEVDGQPWLGSAITPYKATSGATLSSCVTLAAR